MMKVRNMSKSTDELVEKITKSKRKGGTPTMKKFFKTNGKVIAAIVLTLSLVAAFAYTFYSGVTYERRRQADVKAKIEAAVVSRVQSKN